MNEEPDRLVGARVRAADGDLGRIEGREPGESGQQGALLVRSTDGSRLYRVPLNAIATVDDGATPTVLLRVRAGDLERGVGELDDGVGSLRIPVVAEELVAEKQPISLGALRVHKGVRTEEQMLTVPVFHEEALVEHLAPEAYEAARAADPEALLVPIYEEELVIEKRMVLKEYLCVRTRRIEEQRTVSEMVRREYVEITEQAASTVAAGETDRAGRDVVG